MRLWNGVAAGRRELRARIDEIGGPTAHNNYPWGWTMAGNTPFRRWKREVHEGGVADPCIVRWPRGIARDAASVRRQFAHAIDVLPTVLELVGIDAPDRDRRRRSSRRSTARASRTCSTTPTRPSGTTRSTSRCSARAAIYHDGWKAVTFQPLGRMYDDGLDPDAPFDDDVWELYHVADDLVRDATTSPTRSPSGSRR